MNNADKQCVFCNAYLFEDDDVVYCPECGAPHHRECYFKTGQCALQSKHGTDEQYKKPEPKVQEPEEPVSDYKVFEQSEEQGYTPFTRININMPNIDPSINLDDTINSFTIRDVMSFIFVNPIRYIKKFLDFSKGAKVSWNWLAFLFPAPWLFLRKQYKSGFLALILCIASVVLSIPFEAQLNDIMANSDGSYYALLNNMMLSFDLSSIPIFLCAMLGNLIKAAVMVLCGLFGDKLYYSHVFGKLKTLKEREDFEFSAAQLRQAGGVNMWAAFGCMIALQYIPIIISMFIL